MYAAASRFQPGLVPPYDAACHVVLAPHCPGREQTGACVGARAPALDVAGAVGPLRLGLIARDVVGVCLGPVVGCDLQRPSDRVQFEHRAHACQPVGHLLQAAVRAIAVAA
nr:hypothetical protein OH820_02415 [Streptomyces sp. NBC_00857]